ncbi:MAG TPA: carboxypeptidase-like regulatory domain-containing protein [Candidatus Xenobia bacterium]|jgi:hypothetical protein
MMRWWLVILMLVSGRAWAAVPSPSPKPSPVFCEVAVHVVQAGTDRPAEGVPVLVLTSRLVTGTDGVARFHQVPNHPVVFMVAGKPVRVVPDPEHAVDVTVPVVVSVDVVISAVAEGDNGGIAGAVATVDDKTAGVTDERGFLAVHLGIGPHRVRLIHPSYVFVPSVLAGTVKGPEDANRFAFVGRPITGRLRVQVWARGLQGLVPVVGAAVLVQRGQEQTTMTLATGADGAAISDPLVLGRYRVRVEANGVAFGDAVRQVNLSAPGEVWLTVVGQASGGASADPTLHP